MDPCEVFVHWDSLTLTSLIHDTSRRDVTRQVEFGLTTLQFPKPNLTTAPGGQRSRYATEM